MIHISVEGLDGTGKSTLVSALHERMCADQAFTQWIYQTKEPGVDMKVSPGIPIKRPGLNIRQMVLTEASLTSLERELMFYIDASQHKRFIEAQGNAIVVSDRGLWSHKAYLRATLKTGQIDHSAYIICKDVIKLTCPVPDFVIYLRGDIALMTERNANKTKDLIESNKSDYFGYVLETYEDLAFENPNCLILNATNSTSQNVESVITCLKTRYTYDQLKSGNL